MGAQSAIACLPRRHSRWRSSATVASLHTQNDDSLFADLAAYQNEVRMRLNF